MRKILLTLGFVGLISVDASAIVLNDYALNQIRNGEGANFHVFGQAPNYKVPEVSVETMKAEIESATGKKVDVTEIHPGNEASGSRAFYVKPIG